MASGEWEVYSKSFAVCFGVCIVTACIERLLQHKIHDPVARCATAFASFQITAVLSLSLFLLGSRMYGRVKASIHDQIRPAIRDRVMALALEGETWSSDVPGHGAARQALETSIEHALISVKPPGRDRIARFAVQEGFADEWVKAYSSDSTRERKRAISLLGLISPVAGDTILSLALKDQHAAVRLEACRALLASGDQLAVDTVFRSVLTESLLVRALLAADLRRHAAFLLVHTVPSVLEQASSVDVARCFEMLIAWRRALPSFDIHPWLWQDADRSLRPLLFGLLPYVAADRSIEPYLLSALESADLEIQCAAAQAAGRLKLERLMPTLLLNLGRSKQLALASARALAQMGEAGERHLEKVAAGGDKNAAAVAMEALEHITVRTP